MFELDSDIDLDEDFLEDVFHSEDNVPKKNGAKKRSSPVYDTDQSSKRLRQNEEESKNVDCFHENERRTFLMSPHEISKGIYQSKSVREVIPQHPLVRQRKFPGPAGLLPEKGEDLSTGPLPSLAVSSQEQPCSQSSSSVFESALWRQVLSDFGLTDDSSPLRQFNIKWVKRRAAAKQLLDQKVPFLALVVHDVDCSSPDPCVRLRDTTGEIRGTLHREVWEQYGGQLQPCSTVLVLRQVGVLSTGMSVRRHYLNVTSNNIMNIYICTEGCAVRNTVVHAVSRSELLQTVSSFALRERTNLSPLPSRTVTSGGSVVPKASLSVSLPQVDDVLEGLDASFLFDDF